MSDQRNYSRGWLAASLVLILAASTVAHQYKQYDAFRQALAAFDPARRFQSSLSQRLKLKPRSQTPASG